MQDADALAAPAAAPDVAGGGAGVDDVGVARRTARRTGRRRSPAPRRAGRRCAREASPSGRFLTAADEANAAAVVVLGPDTAQRAVRRGATRSVRRWRTTACSLEVIGVLDAAQLLGADVEQRPRDRAAVAPTRSGSSAASNRNSVSSIYVKATSSGTLSAAYQETNALLLNTHKITNPANADFSIATQQSILARGDLGRRHAHRHARRHRGHRAARRRHRRDEHHAGVGHRADPRDRRAQGDRRATAASSAASSSSRRRSSASPAACSASRSVCSARSLIPAFSRLARDHLDPRRARRDRRWRSASAWSSVCTPRRAPLASRRSTP